MSNTPLFDQQGEALTVGSISTSEIEDHEFDAGENAVAAFDKLTATLYEKEMTEEERDLERLLLLSWNNYLVRENGSPIGFCSFARSHEREDYSGRTIRDETTLIPSDRTVNRSTPFSVAVQLFADSELPYWLTDDGKIIGLFERHCLYHSSTIFSYFALTIDLETAALNLCTWFPEAWKNFSGNVNKDRLDRIMKTYVDKFRGLRGAAWREGRESMERSTFREYLIRDVMQCTTFIDKCTILVASHLLIDQDDKRLKAVFNRAEKIRNACAHPLSNVAASPNRWDVETHELFGMNPREISTFVKDCLDVIESIVNVTPQARFDDDTE